MASSNFAASSGVWVVIANVTPKEMMVSTTVAGGIPFLSHFFSASSNCLTTNLRLISVESILVIPSTEWHVCSQHSKLLDNKGKFNRIDIYMVGADGRDREMVAIPVEKLPLWLAAIKTSASKFVSFVSIAQAN
jgi:hypothetical protein